jgi:hypothetical protein
MEATLSTFKFRRALALTAMGACALTLAACASGANPEMMTVTRSATAPAAMAGDAGYHKLSVAAVQGGSDTNPLWMSSVSNADFKAALERSLKGLDYLADDKGAYVVTASITDLQRPLAGLDMSVTIKVRYTVSPTAGGAPLFDDTIAATGTAKFGDSLIAVERLRKANEAAVRANIEAFAQRLKAEMK